MQKAGRKELILFILMGKAGDEFFLIFRNYPRVKPGSQIIPENQKLKKSVQEVRQYCRSINEV
jgi:ASC-1-like (ASCH) protein